MGGQRLGPRTWVLYLHSRSPQRISSEEAYRWRLQWGGRSRPKWTIRADSIWTCLYTNYCTSAKNRVVCGCFLLSFTWVPFWPQNDLRSSFLLHFFAVKQRLCTWTTTTNSVPSKNNLSGLSGISDINQMKTKTHMTSNAKSFRDTCSSSPSWFLQWLQWRAENGKHI